jgi:hypothetical protein
MSPIPDDGWKTVRDRDYEALIAAESADPHDTARVVALWGLLYLCPECGRLMWKREGEKHFRVFNPESPAEPDAAANGEESC